MGFTKTHIVGVFLTESLLGAIAVILIVVSFWLPFEIAQRLLFCAISACLLQIGVLLSSILSLLFYLGSRIETITEEDEDAT